MEKQNTWLVVVNPASGGGKMFRNIEKIKKALTSHGINYDVRFTKKQKDATEIVKNALVTEGYRRIMGIGGDGTCNEIINGIFGQTSVPIADIVYTMYAGGTGNDWVKMHNIPNDLSAFCTMILRGSVGLQDVGVVDYQDKKGAKQRKYFANAGGLAYDSFVVQAVEAVKNRIVPKKFSYFFYILKCLFAYKAERVRIVYDGQNIEEKFYTINIGINRFAGAGMQLTPQAVKDDGLLALTLVPNLPWWKVILYTRYLYSGAIARIPNARLFNVKNIKIEHLNNPIFCEVDGELLGATPVEISIFEHQLKVVVP